jgi:phytoene synthase
MSSAPRRAVRAPRIMGAVYRLILEQTAARGFLPPRRPVKLAKPRIALIIMRYAFI